MWCQQSPSRSRDIRAVLFDFSGTLSAAPWRDPGRDRRGVAGPVFAVSREVTPAGGRLRHDAVTVLTALRYRGFATGVVADWDPGLAATFEALPATAHVDVVVFTGQATSPADAVYLAGCRALRLRPEQCLCVRRGDGGMAAGVGLGRDPVTVRELVDVLALLPPQPGLAPIRGEGANSRRPWTRGPGGRRVLYRNDAGAKRWRAAGT